MSKYVYIWILVSVLATLTISYAKQTVNSYGENYEYPVDEPESISVSKGESLSITCADVHGDSAYYAYSSGDALQGDAQYYGYSSGDALQGKAQYYNYISSDDLQGEAQCIITVDGEVKFNETIDRSNSCEKGISFNSVDDTWNGTIVTVTVEDQNATIHIEVVEIDFKCQEDNPDIQDMNVAIGKDSDPLECVTKRHMTKEEFENVTVSWYHDCDKITEDTPGVTITKKNFTCGNTSPGVVLSELIINNTSVESSPGLYHCVIENQSTSLNVPVASRRVCLKYEHSRANNPLIRPTQESYFVTPGDSVTIVARGKTAAAENTLSRYVTWRKLNEKTDEFERLCTSFGGDGFDKDCNTSFNNGLFCEKLSEHDVVEAIKNVDNFTATFTLKNLTKKDYGMYEVRLVTTKGPVYSNFTIQVYHPPPPGNNSLAIALGIVFGIISLFAVVAIILLFKYRTDIKYFYKKIFNRKPIRDTRPMAYLVYAADVFENTSNPYQAVLNFLGDRRYHDPSNPGLMDNPAGHAVVDHTTDMMRRCMTVVFFVTKDLMSEENHGMEVLEAYRALNENAQSQIPIIFITTRDAQDRLRGEENNNTVFAGFMNRQKNTVIYWDEKHPNRFRRALYVALPNVVYPSADDQITRV